MKSIKKRNASFMLFLCFSFLSFIPLESFSQQQDVYISSSQDCSGSIGEAQGSEKIRLSCDSYHQTTNHTCGPAAVMTLLRYYRRLSPAEMNQKTELRIALEMGSTEDGTSRSQVDNWLSSHGFSVESGVRVDSEMIIGNLKKGIPTIIGVNKHWILAKGFNKGDTPEKDEIVFADSCCNTTIITRADIDSMWLEAQLSQNHCSKSIGEYIVAIPK